MFSKSKGMLFAAPFLSFSRRKRPTKTSKRFCGPQDRFDGLVGKKSGRLPEKKEKIVFVVFE